MANTSRGRLPGIVSRALSRYPCLVPAGRASFSPSEPQFCALAQPQCGSFLHRQPFGTGPAQIQAKPAMRVLDLTGTPILEQLQIEERLLRADAQLQNWCIVNHGIEQPAIVMGISGKPEELLFEEEVKARGVDVIRRFSGGGTVVVDSSTVFITLICNRSAVASLEHQMFPRPIMHWTEGLYSPLFPPSAKFSLLETDYALGDLKFGGNAQAIVKDRWLHHTSFLWDFDATLMASLLRTPQKAPEYRQKRSHNEFLCTLKPLFPSKEIFIQGFLGQCLPQMFDVEVTARELLLPAGDHLSSTRLVKL